MFSLRLLPQISASISVRPFVVSKKIHISSLTQSLATQIFMSTQKTKVKGQRMLEFNDNTEEALQ